MSAHTIQGQSWTVRETYDATVEWLPDSESKLSIEGFYKKYSNYPFSLNDSISLASKGADFGLYGNEPVASIAEGRAFGTEFLYRNRDLFGTNLTISYTLVRSETNPQKATLDELARTGEKKA